MDNYTKMMDAAIKQDLIKWDNPKVGDWTDKGIIIFFEGDDSCGLSTPEGMQQISRVDELIFKPSIEQLMEMVELHFNKKWMIGFNQNDPNVIYPMSSVFFEFTKTVSELFSSMRELWLAFVIHELHGLKWSGKEWE